MDPFLAFLPIDRRQALARDEVLPDRSYGAALFADIKGFTLLTESLAHELGPQQGAEELTHTLNLIYGALIAEVDAYRGSVIGFSGDAITCWFDGDDGWRGVTCALAMQGAMQRLGEVQTPGGNTHTLAIKVAVATGPVRRFLVGDPGYQVIDVLAGQTLEDMSAAEKHARQGEVSLTEEVARRLEGRLSVVDWRAGDRPNQRFAIIDKLSDCAEPNPWPDLPFNALTDQQIRTWLLPDVFERLNCGQSDFLAELRPAVALFLKFGGIDYDNDDGAGLLLDAYIRWVQSILLHYEGVLLQLTIGDKGSYLYAAFGAPVAHGDDTARAVHTALALLKPPTHLALFREVSIGVCRGQMRTGAYGGPTRRTYGVLGDKVNLAARLMNAAQPGQILCEEETVRFAGPGLAFEELPPVKVKGKPEPVTVYHPKGVTAPLKSIRAAILGRVLERQEIQARLSELACGKSQTLVIEGEAGLGKSVLADYLKELAEKRGFQILEGSAEAVEASTPYFAWRRVFYGLFGIDPHAHLDTQQSQFNAWLENLPELQNLAPLLGALLPFAVSENEYTAHMTQQSRSASLRRLLSDLLIETTALSPTVVVLENGHWLDSLSWELALHMARIAGDAPLLLGLVFRPPDEGSPAADHISPLKNLENGHWLTLTPMDPAETTAIAAARLGLPEDGLPPEVAALIGQRAEGNPFFAEELVFALHEGGFLKIEPVSTTKDGEAFILSCSLLVDLAQATGALPGNIQGLVLSRIDRLPYEQQLILKVASVIGRAFSGGPVCHVTADQIEIEAPELYRQLENLASLELTPVLAHQPELTFIFKNLITQEVAYETLLFAQRRRLHASVAEWYESRLTDQFGEQAAVLAYHYSMAGIDDKALNYTLQSAKHAFGLYALKEAGDHYQKALAIAKRLDPPPPLTTIQYIQLRLGEVLVTTGEYEKARQHLEASLAACKEIGDAEAEAKTCRWLSRLYENLADYPASLEWVERGLDSLAGTRSTEEAELLLIAGLIHTRQGHYDEGLSFGERSMRTAQMLKDENTLARACNLLGHITRLKGQSTTAIERFQQALVLYRKTGDLHGQGTSHNQIANAYFNIGLWQEASLHYNQSRRLFGDIGDLYSRALAENNLGGIALNQGRYDDALDYYQGGLHAMKQIGGSIYVQGVLHMNLGATHIRRGDIQTGCRQLETSQEYFEQAQAREFLPELNRWFGEAALSQGQLLDADRYARIALDLSRQLEMRGEEGNALRLLGEVFGAHRENQLAQECLEKSIFILGEMCEEFEQARSRLALAKIMITGGGETIARRLLDQCRPVFERLQALPELDEIRNKSGKDI
jgi:adenylate cyclase